MKLLAKILFFAFISSVAFGQQVNNLNGWEKFLAPSFIYDTGKTFSYLETGGYQTYTLVGYTNGDIFIEINYSKDFSKIFSGGYTKFPEIIGFRGIQIKNLVNKEKITGITIGLAFQYGNYYISHTSCRINLFVQISEWEEIKFDMTEVKKYISNFDRVIIKIWIMSMEIGDLVGTEISLNDLFGKDSTEVVVYDSFDITDVEDKMQIPTGFALEQNYPNPFNPATTIRYQLPISDQVSLKVYDLLGREVATLVNEYQPAGTHEVEFSGRDISSGVYVYRLQTRSFTETKKMTFVK